MITEKIKQIKPVSTKKRNSLLAVLLIMVLMVCLILYFRSAFYPLLFGSVFGYILQRSRFCFTGGFRDIFLIKNTTLTRAVLIALGLTTVGFSLVGLLSGGESYLETAGVVYPLGMHNLLGGTLFGFGMVIAGACVSGCLVRIGEGYIMQIYTFIGLMIGSVLGAWNYGWWQEVFISQAPTVYLPQALGWAPAIFIQLTFIVFLYVLSIRYEKGRWPLFKLPVLPKKLQLSGIMRKKSWSYTTGAVLIAVTNTLLLYFWDRPWRISGGIAHVSAWIMEGAGIERVGINPFEWTYFAEESSLECINCFYQHPLIYLALAMILGSLAATLVHNEFRWRKPRNPRYILSALVGGLLMGYSSRMVMGCNIGGFLGGISSLSLHGWLFGLFILLGAYLGGKVLMRYLL